MQSSIKISGIGQLTNNLKKLRTVVDKEAGESAMKSAEQLRDRIGQKAPLGPTGRLKKSPVAKRYGNVAIAGVDRKKAPHAHLVEFGTSHSAAHPYFRPAVAEMKSKTADNFKDDVGKSISGAF